MENTMVVRVRGMSFLAPSSVSLFSLCCFGSVSSESSSAVVSVSGRGALSPCAPSETADSAVGATTPSGVSVPAWAAGFPVGCSSSLCGCRKATIQLKPRGAFGASPSLFAS
ncbi:hypothetical protein LP52_15695 [Streptomonospora alba]|uniref:Uncharacterized protein n=1 Tax=Streptomonospora alba TaxID=183763 RepID=A0A0C2G4C7_9ACTN|nr:hypothetical protein LP52_15695 [Streptomonospora alba]